MEQETILEKLFAREESAIDLMQQSYGAYCAAIARNVLSSDEDVEEILNDTWFRAWSSIPPERPKHLKLYLARIARNLSIDRLRNLSSQKRSGAQADCALDELAQCIGRSSPDHVLEAEALQNAINRFLFGLSQRDRQIFLYRYFRVEPTAVIANHFAIREDHVRAILSRTRKKLRIYLKKEGFLDG